MEMIVTSEITALKAIRITANTGSVTRTNALPVIDSGDSVRPAKLPRPMKTTTGMTMVPAAPMGSRMKILISSQVSFRRPRSTSIPDRVAGQREEHILEAGQHGPEVGDADPVLRQAVDHGGDEVLAASLNREAEARVAHRLDLGHLP